MVYWSKLRQGTPVVVYQMGKVGSSSILDSLVNYGIKPVFHVHNMIPASPNSIERERFEKSGLYKMLIFSTWLGFPGLLYADIVKKRKVTGVKFITLVREPISRNIADFFQNFTYYTGFNCDTNSCTLEVLTTTFIENIRHTLPLDWFDEEINSALGIDVFKYTFPKEKGYLIIRKGNIELLIIKMEIDDSVKEKAISEFLDIGDFKLTRSNVAHNKTYGPIYKDFSKTVKLPESYIRLMYTVKYTRHFYTNEEIAIFESKWRNRVSDTKLPLAIHEKLIKASSGTID